MTMPQTMYRSTRFQENREREGDLDSRRRVVGIESLIADTHSLHLVLNLITNRIRTVTGRVILNYVVDQNEVVVSPKFPR